MERRSQKDPGENICAAGGCSALVKREVTESHSTKKLSLGLDSLLGSAEMLGGVCMPESQTGKAEVGLHRKLQLRLDFMMSQGEKERRNEKEKKRKENKTRERR